jgi:hypothetical protein
LCQQKIIIHPNKGDYSVFCYIVVVVALDVSECKKSFHLLTTNVAGVSCSSSKKGVSPIYSNCLNLFTTHRLGITHRRRHLILNGILNATVFRHNVTEK